MSSDNIVTIIQKLKEHETLDFLTDYIDEKESAEGVDEEIFRDLATEAIQEQEITYYKNAMDHLLENDASLMLSLGLADDFGLSAKNLNSEKLATILLQNNLQEDLDEFIKENF